MSMLIRLYRSLPLVVILVILAIIIYLVMAQVRTPVRAKEVLIKVFTWISGIIIGFFGIVSLYALFERNNAVLDLSVGFMLVGVIALTITLLCRYLFRKHHPHYKRKPMTAHTATRWRKVAQNVRNAQKAAKEAASKK